MTRWWMCAGHSTTHSAADHFIKKTRAERIIDFDRVGSGDVDVRLSIVARMAAVLGKMIEWTLVDASE
jgi:hypothetical protein